MKNILALLLSSILLLLSDHGFANAGVSAKYVDRGDVVQICIHVSSPAPPAFIVMQKHARGVHLIAANPLPVNGLGKPAAKWLFRRPASGNHTIVLRFSKPIAPNQVKGEIRYRHPGNQAMITKNILREGITVAH
ncbi:MAG: hypothetical protein CSA33_06875 [Desulfobulbus propionicus]|nr:MAG: hypothetical protein CSA33_06875 [Desulfobulbus propionicus]